MPLMLKVAIFIAMTQAYACRNSPTTDWTQTDDRVSPLNDASCADAGGRRRYLCIGQIESVFHEANPRSTT